MSKKITLTMSELANRFDEIMFFPGAKGFTVGKGKAMHWHIEPSKSGFYYAYKIDNSLGGVGYRRVVESDKLITVHYK